MKNLILNRLNSLQKLKESKKYWNITWLQGIFLSQFIEINKPKYILEVGTSNGFSTLWLAKTAQSNTIIHTIEINKDRQKQAIENFKFCQLDNIISHLGDAIEIIPKLQEITSNDLIKFDIVFIDAKQEKYIDIIEIIEKHNLLNDNPTFIVDNVVSHNMTEFTDKMKQKYHCELIELGGGMLFAQKLIK